MLTMEHGSPLLAGFDVNATFAQIAAQETSQAAVDQAFAEMTAPLEAERSLGRVAFGSVFGLNLDSIDFDKVEPQPAPPVRSSIVTMDQMRAAGVDHLFRVVVRDQAAAEQAHYAHDQYDRIKASLEDTDLED